MANIFGMFFPVIYIHLGALLFLFITILVADKQAFAWIRGKKEVLSRGTLNVLHTLVWSGLIVMIVTGILMALPLSNYLLQEPSFYVKMFFVLVLVINSFFIGSFMKKATEKPFSSLSQSERLPILISGGVSTASWIGAFIAALIMTTSNWLLRLISLII